jgi:hypothetical protein
LWEDYSPLSCLWLLVLDIDVRTLIFPLPAV